MGKLFKIALALFLIGVGCVAIFTMLTDEPIWGSVNEEDYTLNEIVYEANDFSGFDFTFENRDFIVMPSEDGKIKVTYYTTNKDRVIVSDSGASLVLNNEVDWVFKFFNGWTILTNPEFYDVYIYLPETVQYDLNLDTSNGAFTMSDFDNIEDIDFDTSNGGINISNSDVKSIDVTTSNGSINITDVVVADDFNVYTSNGKIELTNVVGSDLIKLKTSNGRIILNYVTAVKIDGRTSNQAIKAENLTCDEAIFDSSNGSITVSINGNKDDYEVRMSTSNGDLTYDGIEVSQERFNEDAPKSIDLETSNGDITLTFNE